MNLKNDNAKYSRNFPKILILSFGHLCHDIFTSFLSPILPKLIEKLSLTYSQAGFISVILRLPSLLNPFIGAYAEKYDTRYFIILSPSITAIAICFMGSVPSYTGIIILAFVAGIGSSCFHVPSPVLLKQFSGNRVGAAMSFFQIGGESARTIGPIIILGAVSIWTIDGMYKLIPLGLIISIIFYWQFRDLPRNIAKPRHNISASIMKTILNERALFISMIGILITKSFTASIVSAFLPTYLTSIGKSFWFSGSALSIVEAAAIAGVFASGTLSDRFGCKKMLLLITLVTPISMLIFLYSTGWIFLLSLVLLGFTAFSSAPVILSMIQKRGFHYPVIANGVYMTINFVLSSSSIFFAGFFSDMLGIEYTFKLFAACSPVGILFVFFLKEK